MKIILTKTRIILMSGLFTTISAVMFIPAVKAENSSLFGKQQKQEKSYFRYKVPGIVPIRTQPTRNTCWATVTTMMLSWRDKSNYRIQDAMNIAGPIYRKMFDADRGLAASEKRAFLLAAGLRGEPFMNYSVSKLLSLLKKHGPLWVTTDENTGEDFSIHARIVIGMYGDGSINGTKLIIIDPASGQQDTETFKRFSKKFEDVLGTSKKPLQMRLQVVHF